MEFNLSQAEFVRTVDAARSREALRAPAAPPRRILTPLGLRLLGDQLTPVLAYRRLVVGDPRTAPSFLLESVEGGERVGRYSMLGAAPTLEITAWERRVVVDDRREGAAEARRQTIEPDPLLVARRLGAQMLLVLPEEANMRGLPGLVMGGWVGFAGYDSVRYAEPEKLGWERAPHDDRGLPDLHLGFYPRVVVFDHAQTLVHVVELVDVGPDADAPSCYARASAGLMEVARALQHHSKPLPSGVVGSREEPPRAGASNMTPASHTAMIARAKEYIRAGDIFQVVLGQRFERRSKADPFDVYRALRAVNPSPYMGYIQCAGCILVASSPEILCRVKREAPGAGDASVSEAEPGAGPALVVTNRPLAGTRRRGTTASDDAALERELLADQKERSEHIMLVDLGRNDVGRVAKAGTVRTPALMQVERYSHVMHISSTVTGELAPGLDCWDALRAALPAGTISGAPKVRAMQIIDELEPVRRGPYGGGFGHISPGGEMDMALALRTMVVPTGSWDGSTWLYHLQASGGIVFDSVADAEFSETVNKAAALSRAIDVAERAFAGPGGSITP